MTEQHIDLLPAHIDIPGFNQAKKILLFKGENLNTQARCQIKVNNDIEAVNAWLQEYINSPNTFRAYQKEAQRLLLWCALVANKPLSSLTRDDFAAYSEFLKNPQPASIWCGAKSAKSKNWKPFVKGLERPARSTAMIILHSLLEYLAEADYLLKNPLRLLRKKVVDHQEKHRLIESFKNQLEADEILALLKSTEMPLSSDKDNDFLKARLHFLIYLLTLTGLRNHEIRKIRWQDFCNLRNCWWLYIVGKGKKPRLVPVTDELLQIIKKYRITLGKLPYPTPEDDDFVITRIDLEAPLSERGLNKIIHQHANNVASNFIGKADKSERLKQISAHGFRHIFASLQSQFGIPTIQIRDSLGHSDVKTTESYIHTADIMRHKALNKLELIQMLAQLAKND